MAQTVLVTGASGFVGAHVVEQFLAAGYKVRAAVRSDSTAERVRKEHPNYPETLEFAIVPDIAVEGAFDEAIKGVDGAIHVASPFVLDAKDIDKDLYEPAVNGTLGVLKAAKKFAPTVKRVVITSSFAAILDFQAGTRPGYTYNEKDWNPRSAEAAKADPVDAYLVSKKLAEKAAYDFVESEKPTFTISTLDPPMVYGPIAHTVNNVKSLNTSSSDFYRLFNGSEKEVPPTAFYACVDVRDLAKAHVLAFESEKAANQRYLITQGSFTYEDFANLIRAKFPELAATTPAPSKPVPEYYNVDNSKSINDLGLTYRSLEETVVDTVNSLRAIEAASA